MQGIEPDLLPENLARVERENAEKTEEERRKLNTHYAEALLLFLKRFDILMKELNTKYRQQAVEMRKRIEEIALKHDKDTLASIASHFS